MKNNLLKKIILLILILLLCLIVFIDKNGNGIEFKKLNNIKIARKEKNDLVNKIIINNVTAIYDKNENVYYYNLPKKYENKKYVLSLKFDDNFKYKINDQILNTVGVKYDKDINLIVYNDKYYYTTKIRFTNLPIINIVTDQKQDIVTREDVSSKFTYINNSYFDSEINYSTKIHIRGDTSSFLPKKSYRIDFYDDVYDKNKNINFSSFYSHDTLVLQSLYSDPSKIRNKLETDIWNDVSKDFKNTSLYSEFVEVFINNEYKGLYVLSESINRKKLNLPKTDDLESSVIIKVVNYDKFPNVDNDLKYSSDEYGPFQIKYPNDTKKYDDVWKNIIPKLYNYYDISPITYDSITSTFNLKNYIDLILFNDFTANVDNSVKKNSYYYKNNIYDDVLFIEPWDMEISFGLYYKYDSPTKTVSNYSNSNKSNMVDYKSSRINNLVKLRYNQLKSNIFSEEYLYKLIDTYYDEIKYSSKRDSNLYYKYNLDKEIENIKGYIHNRIEYYDEYVNSL